MVRRKAPEQSGAFLLISFGSLRAGEAREFCSLAEGAYLKRMLLGRVWYSKKGSATRNASEGTLYVCLNHRVVSGTLWERGW